MNYGELVTAIKDYTQNTETTFVNHINEFIQASEDRIFMAVEMPAHWKTQASVTLVANTSEYTLDAGVVDVFSVRVSEGTTAQAAGVEFGPVRYLLQKDYDFLLEAYPGSSSAEDAGVPKYYAVSSAGVSTNDPTLTIRLAPAPDAVYPTTVDYYGKTTADSITNGSVDATTTWISTVYPEALLYGSLVDAYTYMKGDPGLLNEYKERFAQCVGVVKGLGESRQQNDSFKSDGVPAR